MSYIITDDKHYKDIAKSLRSKMQTDREYYPKDMAIAIDNIPSSADETDNPITGIYFLKPNENGYPTKTKISGWNNPTGGFPALFGFNHYKPYLKTVEFINCNFKILSDNIFQNCTALASVTIPDSVTTIGNSAFFNCTALASVTIPDSVTTIGNSAFSNCSSLKSVIIQNGVVTIGNSAFFNCKNLNELYLPNSLACIASDAFYECRAVHKLTFEQGFNLSFSLQWFSQNYTREQIVSWLNALADRTGQTANKLTMGATNLAKLTEEDILIATNKNWTLA